MVSFDVLASVEQKSESEANLYKRASIINQRSLLIELVLTHLSNNTNTIGFGEVTYIL